MRTTAGMAFSASSKDMVVAVVVVLASALRLVGWHLTEGRDCGKWTGNTLPLEDKNGIESTIVQSPRVFARKDLVSNRSLICDVIIAGSSPDDRVLPRAVATYGCSL